MHRLLTIMAVTFLCLGGWLNGQGLKPVIAEAATNGLFWCSCRMKRHRNPSRFPIRPFLP
jgi:hypothetical protein